MTLFRGENSPFGGLKAGGIEAMEGCRHGKMFRRLWSRRRLGGGCIGAWTQLGASA